MSLAFLALAHIRLGTPRDYRRRIWKSLAFVGRYGNQPADVWLERPTADLMEYADELAEIMREEGEAMRSPHGS